ncbi:MAG: nitrogenase component 1, partial [Ignavibacteria bacterium]|nr:nitrogenase component 1 [Ignavibacteria bacterium]
QTTFCQEWLSMLTLATIKDTVTISHAPVGCASSLTCINIFNRFGQVLRGDEPQTGKWISTNLKDSDAIHGGEENLKEAILEADKRYSPKAIFIHSSCVSGIIGEDIDGTVRQVQNEVSAHVIPVYCDGFKSKLWASGYDGSFQGALNHLIKEPEKKQEDLVNIINPITFGRVDELEAERLLNKIGLRANFIPNFSTTEDIAQASEAALTASLCTTFSEYFAKTLNERFSVPYTEQNLPLGLDNTDSWLREIAGILGKDEEAEKVIKEERERIQPKIDEIKEKLEGKTAFVSAGQSRAIGIPTILADLGIEIVGITAYHYDEVIADGFADLEKRCGNFCTNVANVQPFEQTNILNKLKPDFYFGHMGESVWAAKEGIPTTMVFNLGHLFAGYNGVVSFGSRILNLKNNSSFSKKLSKHAKPIYRENWLDENPFKYHKGAE